MDKRQRQTVLLLGVMAMLAVGTVFILSDMSSSRDTGLIEGQLLPEPFNSLVNQSINGLSSISEDFSGGQEAVEENGGTDLSNG